MRCPGSRDEDNDEDDEKDDEENEEEDEEDEDENDGDVDGDEDDNDDAYGMCAGDSGTSDRRGKEVGCHKGRLIVVG